jgi:integrase
VEKWKAERSKETGFTEVDNELKTLKHMLNKSIEWRMASENPARSLKLFRKTQKRERFLSHGEMGQLLTNLPFHQRPLIQFALLTGLRRANLLNLRWEQVDLDNGNLLIPAEETKSKRDLKLPLAPEAEELWRNQTRHPESDFVFCKANGEPYKYIYKGFREAIKKAGIKDCTLHTLRHTMGSHLVMAGVDLATVKELLGHRDIQTPMRYAHLAQDQKRQAIRKLGTVFTKPQEGGKGLRIASVTP